MVRVSIQLKMALGLSVLILIALLWKIPEPLQDDSVWTDKIVHLLIFMILESVTSMWAHKDLKTSNLEILERH
tara:strand:- start:193 stop:411 length:219 start_codon:yes stop_codon:yes gene_type:complete